MEDSMIENEDDLKRRLAEAKAKRGYLLPHHGLLALASPDLLAAYDRAYTALALDPRVLSVHDREFVWLAILIATDEAHATHHIPKFRSGGGTDSEIEGILALTALALGARAYGFVGAHWRAHLPAIDVRRAYLAATGAVRVDGRLAHLALAAIHACAGAWEFLRWEIAAAYDANVPEVELAEALSLVMFPGSVPRFVEAAGVWRDMIAKGEVAASRPFAVWAGMAGQGGYDEASGLAKP
jgi:alkylhydroperoxidase/carboxymuconolactone decarboxylase family protein YurZ